MDWWLATLIIFGGLLTLLATGLPVAFSFRKKYYDQKRDIHGYFWKAVPQKEVA